MTKPVEAIEDKLENMKKKFGGKKYYELYEKGRQMYEDLDKQLFYMVVGYLELLKPETREKEFGWVISKIDVVNLLVCCNAGDPYYDTSVGVLNKWAGWAQYDAEEILEELPELKGNDEEIKRIAEKLVHTIAVGITDYMYDNTYTRKEFNSPLDFRNALRDEDYDVSCLAGSLLPHDYESALALCIYEATQMPVELSNVYLHEQVWSTERDFGKLLKELGKFYKLSGITDEDYPSQLPQIKYYATKDSGELER